MSYFAKRTKRIVAGMLVGGLALSVTPMLGFSTAGALDPPTGDGSVCEDPPEAEPFTDVGASDIAVNEITCLVNTGITQGVTATTYVPTGDVTRRQMALFLVRLADQVEEHGLPGQVTPLPAGDGVTPFTDIAAESAETKTAIDRLNEAGIAEGVTATTFVPGDTVTRRQMAKFLVRLQEFLAGEDITPDSPPDAFSDDNGDSGEAELNVLAAEGVFVGNASPAGTVSPGADISRRQMALVLMRKAQYLFEEGVMGRFFAEDDTNVAFSPSPAGQVVVQTDPDTGDAPGTFVNFTGLGSVAGGDVDVSLIPLGTEDVDPYVTDAGGIFSFLDEDLDGLADGTELIDDERSTHGVDHSNPDIFTTSVNGVACSGSQICDDAAVNAGSVNVRLDFDSDPSDSAWLLVWDDVDGDDRLDLGANNQPTEPFGISGPIVNNVGEETLGSCPDDDVYFVDKAANRIWLMDNDGTYIQYGSAGDTYSYDDYIPLSESAFEANLSVGDGVYFPDLCYTPGGPNEFALVDNQANMPTGVAAAVGDFDANPVDTAANDVRVTWTAPNPANGFVDEYDIYRDGVYWDTVNDTTTYVDVDAAPGTYQYRVESITHDDYGSSSLSEPASATVAAPPPGPVAGDPISVSAVFQDPDTNGLVSSGDTLAVTFNEPMAAPGAGDSIEITDADGTVVTITNGTNATFALSGNGVTLSITLTAAPVTDTAGTTAGAQYGSAEVTTSTGNVDADEANEWDLVGSTDVTF